MKTCRHFRFQIPREDADDLRDADPEPCEVCDSMPHRRRRMGLQSDPSRRFLGTPIPAADPVVAFESKRARWPEIGV